MKTFINKILRLILPKDIFPVSGHCKDCEFWKYNRYVIDTHHCALAESHGDAEHPESKSISRDADYYHAYLETQPDFGCIQYKVRVAGKNGYI
jgi:hypothetical protein